MNPTPAMQGLKPLSTAAVIDVMNRAMGKGFRYGAADWSNLGQGAPETGPIDGDIDRLVSIPCDSLTMGYAPIAGVAALREAVAQLYNDLYRRGMASQYTAENVCISGGGRLGLARMLAALDCIRVGHFTPDYASYEQLLSMFQSITPVTISLPEEAGFRITPTELGGIIEQQQLAALLISNPCNPTGQLIAGAELQAWVEQARARQCMMIFDEFYSHYVYADAPGIKHHMVSAAAFVDDVNADPVVLCEGLTKNWRYPGYRLCWTVGPRAVIAALSSIASSMDGGPCHPLQVAAVPLLKTNMVIQKTAAMHRHFSAKADFLLAGLKRIGIRVPFPPQGSFYCFGQLDALPKTLRRDVDFVAAALEQKVICVAGSSFDIRPTAAKTERAFSNFVRFSFGPGMDKLSLGLEGLTRLIQAAS